MASTTVEDRANFDEKLKVEARASMEHLSVSRIDHVNGKKRERVDLRACTATIVAAFLCGCWMHLIDGS